MKRSIAAAFGGLLASGFLWVLAPVAAHADPDADNQRALQQFENYMASHGAQSDVSSISGSSYVGEGGNVCTALRAGQSPGSQIGRLEGLMSRAEASNVVFAARQYLCPGI